VRQSTHRHKERDKQKDRIKAGFANGKSREAQVRFPEYQEAKALCKEVDCPQRLCSTHCSSSPFLSHILFYDTRTSFASLHHQHWIQIKVFFLGLKSQLGYAPK